MTKSNQVSDSLLLSSLITFSGGFQDAYTYFARDKVFANAQTGNIVLLASHIFDGNYQKALRYLLPLIFFSIGVIISEQIEARYKHSRNFHWRQNVLVLEIIILTITAFIPQGYNLLASSIVSLSCAMQVQAFRHFLGNAYASTMCIGNLRSAMSNISNYLRTKEHHSLSNGLHYLFIIFIFFLGAALGWYLNNILGLYSILISSFVLLLAVICMHKKRIS